MIAVLLLLVGVALGAGAPASDCVAWGYNPDTLLCTTCVEFQSFVQDDAATNECFQCCAEDREQNQRTFHSVRLIVDRARVQFWPSLESWLNKHLFKFEDRVVVVNRAWWRPVLECLDASEIVVESLAVDSWDQSQLTAFLEERVRRR